MKFVPYSAVYCTQKLFGLPPLHRSIGPHSQLYNDISLKVVQYAEIITTVIKEQINYSKQNILHTRTASSLSNLQESHQLMHEGISKEIECSWVSLLTSNIFIQRHYGCNMRCSLCNEQIYKFRLKILQGKQCSCNKTTHGMAYYCNTAWCKFSILKERAKDNQFSFKSGSDMGLL